MAAQQDRRRAEDAIFIADMHIAQNKAKEAKGKATSAKGSQFNVRWVERDAEGRPLLKRCRSGETRKRASDKARNDMLTVHAIGWNRRKQEGLHLALSSRYIKTFKKAEAESQRLEDLSSELGCPENIVHQWVHDVRQWATDESINILTKKKIFDAYMSKVRLQEEKIIVMREMRRHCTDLRRLAGNIRTKISEMSSGKNSGSLSEEGRCGLLCLHQKRLADVVETFQVVCSSYSQALGPNAASLLEDGPEEILEDHEEVDYESSDDSDFEAV